MDETAKGFRLGGGGIFSWGTRFNAVARDFEGAGYTTIDIGRRRVRDEWKSRGIADAVRLLERLPGLPFHRHSGHDA